MPMHLNGTGADRRIDLLKGARFPSPLGTVASGFNRSVKPDVFFPGGRQLYLQRPGNQIPPFFSVAASPQAPACASLPRAFARWN